MKANVKIFWAMVILAIVGASCAFYYGLAKIALYVLEWMFKASWPIAIIVFFGLMLILLLMGKRK